MSGRRRLRGQAPRSTAKSALKPTNMRGLLKNEFWKYLVFHIVTARAGITVAASRLLRKHSVHPT